MYKYERTKGGLPKCYKRLCKVCNTEFYSQHRWTQYCGLKCIQKKYTQKKKLEESLDILKTDEKECPQCLIVRNVDFFDKNLCLSCKKENDKKRELEKRMEQLRKEFEQNDE